ncbi:MAG TPA: hypothetical protein VHZ53_16480 [Steroidobacteraceae bacterium]|jgi:hypothetical protein|nr:hypothetical protein [Steroidobacteraceae bacterium]
MHASFQELLAFRDGEPIDSKVRLHVGDCADCGAEVTRMRELRTRLEHLPDFAAPPTAWSAARASLHITPVQPSRYGPALWAGGGMAACIAAFLWMTHHVSTSAIEAVRPAAIEVRAARDGAIAPLVAHSQRLEALLRALPPRPRVEQAMTSATIADLETRIQWLDLKLAGVSAGGANEDEVRRLWDTRVRLLNSLVYVRYAESARAGFRAASPLELGVI